MFVAARTRRRASKGERWWWGTDGSVQTVRQLLLWLRLKFCVSDTTSSLASIARSKRVHLRSQRGSGAGLLRITIARNSVKQ